MRKLLIVLLVMIASLVLVIAAQAQDAIGVGDTVTGSLENSQAHYTLTLAAGESVVINLTSPDFDTLIEVLDSSGAQVGRDDDGGDGLNSRLQFSAPADDTYTIVVRGFGGDATGQYTLSALGFDATPIAVGESVTITFDAQTTLVYFSFEAAEGAVFDIVGDSGDTIDTRITVNGPDGREVAHDDDGGSGLDPFVHNFIAPETGVYVIVFEPFSLGSIGTATLSLSEGVLISLDAGPTTVDLSEIDTEIVVFTATAGATYRVSVVSASGTVGLFINIAPQNSFSGTSVSISSTTELTFTFIAEESGLMIMEISGFQASMLEVSVTAE